MLDSLYKLQEKEILAGKTKTKNKEKSPKPKMREREQQMRADIVPVFGEYPAHGSPQA